MAVVIPASLPSQSSGNPQEATARELNPATVPTVITDPGPTPLTPTVTAVVIPASLPSQSPENPQEATARELDPATVPTVITDPGPTPLTPTVTAVHLLKHTPILVPTPVPTGLAAPVSRRITVVTRPTATGEPTPLLATIARPNATREPTPLPTPHLRHSDEKLYMLDLINRERKKAGVLPVALGDNNAAQLHAEASLEGCYSSHWSRDGLKPYMRYSLAGGYQSNGENLSGSDYCIKARDGYAALSDIKTEIRETMMGWMTSGGHRRNILEKSHRKVNIGLAWDRYNHIAVQHFEGDYVEYTNLPRFDGGDLKFEGEVKNGARFDVGDTISVQIFYDPPPHPLTGGQLSRTYCYGTGRPVVYVREPLTGGWYYDSDSLSTSYTACPDPYDVPPDAPAPRSPNEAHSHWREAYRASQSLGKVPAVMRAITAASWTAGGNSFSITANIGSVLKKHGPGAYTVVLWGDVGGETEIISEYSIFHEIPRPDGYD